MTAYIFLWLLDVWLIHNAFLSAINRLWEFGHMHTHTPFPNNRWHDNHISSYVTHSNTHSFYPQTRQLSVTADFAAVALSLSYGQAGKSIWSHRGPRTTNTERPQNNKAHSQTLPVWCPSMRKDPQIIAFAVFFPVIMCLNRYFICFPDTNVILVDK